MPLPRVTSRKNEKELRPQIEMFFMGMEVGAATLENSMEVPQKTKNRTTLQPSNCAARHLSKGYRYAV